MRRRRYLATLAGGSLAITAGCTGRLLGPDVDFELVEPALPFDEPPDVVLEGDTVTARGTVRYASSACGTVDLAHAAHERSQERLDLLVVAANDSLGVGGCTDDLVEMGYRLEATVGSRLRRATVTEHHAFGEAYSTTVGE